jgi:hypothetical protein
MFKSASPDTHARELFDDDRQMTTNTSDLHTDILELFEAKCVDSQVQQFLHSDLFLKGTVDQIPAEDPSQHQQ